MSLEMTPIVKPKPEPIDGLRFLPSCSPAHVLDMVCHGDWRQAAPVVLEIEQLRALLLFVEELTRRKL